ncbi:hypothetical protein DQ04_03471000 [Trypanosoma grayi]|uniref:hypothetical protein n=1 Tax=Trypanosoma grayi TaxID=71804 RepID=UPI0004F46D7F|nr:hypothetical protein DQ04_03471000 [Trypanosoma grayi]KEG10640.1 hypothetical protein DQ04_03471000 [Trypanosoma grayi]
MSVPPLNDGRWTLVRSQYFDGSSRSFVDTTMRRGAQLSDPAAVYARMPLSPFCGTSATMATGRLPLALTILSNRQR